MRNGVKGGKVSNTRADIDSAIAAAVRRGCSNVCVTLGADGYSSFQNGKIVHVQGFKVDAVDTTGAGDVFHGAFAAALCLGKDLNGSLKFAAAAAALKCTKPGGRSGIPSRGEVEEFCRLN
jgi:sulfofructose kinase